MNESLHRALFRAHLSEEDVAARLQVDTKTVRRWLEGRVPYPRHRWLLAAALGLDEADLWPQLSASRSWSPEVKAIYPHLKGVPRETWLHLFGQAQERIDILTETATFLAVDPQVMTILADRAASGVKERICLCGPDVLDVGPHESRGTTHRHTAEVLAPFRALRHGGNVEVRERDEELTNFIYRSDDECLVTQNIYGISAPRAPVIYLHHTKGDDLFVSYLESFEVRWARM